MRLAVVIPIGPHCRDEFISDTLDSIDAYCVPDRRIVLVDDSHRGTGAEVAAGREHVEVIETPVARGTHGGLYLSLSEGMRVLLREPFDVLLRLDTDAIVTAPGWEAAAVELFHANPRLGSLGHCRFTPSGEPRSHAYAAARIAAATSMKGLAKLRNPAEWKQLRQLVADARAHGYEGEAVLGGIAVYRPEALRDLDAKGLLGSPALAHLGVEEDYAFGLALRALGWELGEFGSDFDDLPMYARHKGLAAHPNDILAKGKALVHSTKSWGDLDEPAIREIFRAARG
jgi:GT2 family glycosyltransferase